MTGRINTRDVANLIGLLQEKPRSRTELSELTGLSPTQILHWARNNLPSMHVAVWGPDKKGRLFVQKLSWGAGADVARPGRVLTPTEAVRKSRLKKKAEREASIQVP